MKPIATRRTQAFFSCAFGERARFTSLRQAACAVYGRHVRAVEVVKRGMDPLERDLRAECARRGILWSDVYSRALDGRRADRLRRESGKPAPPAGGNDFHHAKPQHLGRPHVDVSWDD